MVMHDEPFQPLPSQLPRPEEAPAPGAWHRDVDLGPWDAPSATRTPYYGRVRLAWRDAIARGDLVAESLELALRTFARDARAREVPVTDLMKALDAVLDSRAGGDEALDRGDLREWAGLVVIRAYFRDD